MRAARRSRLGTSIATACSDAERGQGSDDLLAIELDVTSPESAAAAVAACEERFGGLDTLVNSAGVIAFNPLSGDQRGGVGLGD